MKRSCKRFLLHCGLPECFLRSLRSCGNPVSERRLALNGLAFCHCTPAAFLCMPCPLPSGGREMSARLPAVMYAHSAFLGGAINFVYPANVLNNYSCISFAGFETLFYHGLLVFCAVMMLSSGYHRYTRITKWWQLLLPAFPMLAVSVVANLVNYSPINSDYMFFKLNSFVFAPIGAALPPVAAPVLVYGLYLVIHAMPYVPSFIANNIKKRKMRVAQK